MNRIKLIRFERHLKGCELARKAGITPAYLTIIEKGRVPSKSVKVRIANALALPLKELWQ